ncbi:MAG TPA: hypothetical protein VN260_07715, partial [Dissulfurispiraceae bacterium]|nr:hypothetical protein [Dissulfurispiraceae bacterium]
MTSLRIFAFLLPITLIFSLCLISPLLAQTPHDLTVNAVPSQGGTVKADCGSPCRYNPGTWAHLMAEPGSGYVFDTWSGDCQGSGRNPSAALRMDSPKSCVANFSFCADLPLRRAGFSFGSFHDAYSSASSGDIIQALATTILESLRLDRTNIAVTLKGGYICGFAANPSYTLLQGQMVVAAGAGTIERVMVLSGMPPVITSFTADPSSIIQGNTSTLSWVIADATTASISGGVGTADPIDGSRTVSPTATITYTLTATNPYGADTAEVTIAVLQPMLPKITTFSASPDVISSGQNGTLTWQVTDATAVSIDQGIGSVNSSGTMQVNPALSTAYTITATNADGSVTRTIIVGVIPPDPETVASPIDQTVATSVYTSTSFLYTGSTPVQTGMAPDTIEARRVAVIRGKALDRENNPLPGVTITILNHPGYGQTLTRPDGMFDIAVNGGGALTVNYAKTGYLSAQRQVNVPWQDFAWTPDVVMTQQDPQVTPINLESPSMQVARGSVQTDADGSRQATLLFPQGTQAHLIMPDGSTQAITDLSVRATEYTVGPNGAKAMPAELPPTSAYTYCAEINADEAVAAGAADVLFSQPIYLYLENFKNFPTGIQVPVGAYDKGRGAWAAYPDGRVIKILSITGGLASLDTTGNGLPDNGEAIGVTSEERQLLASLYTAGQTLWRVPIPHFTQPYDLNYGIVPPLGATVGALAGAVPGNANYQNRPCTSQNYGCIEYQNQVFGENVTVTGTPHRLHYSSDRVAGYVAANSLKIPLSDAATPPALKRIDLEVLFGGCKLAQSFPPLPNQEYSFFWDGRDAYGRLLQGRQAVTIRIGYVYDGYYALPPSMNASFGAPSGVRIPGDIPARQEVTLWQEAQSMINLWDARSLGLGGWSLSPHHVYDPLGKELYYGDGRRRSVDNMKDVFETYAGGGNVLGDGGQAVHAMLRNPRGITVGPDGSLYIADTGNYRVRKVTTDGTIATVAGNGEFCVGGQPCGD